MQRERVSEDVYVFISDLYAQVTASAIITSAGVVLFDTLAYPEETLQMKRFLEVRLGQEVRYVVNSHFHADHTLGTCLFPDATVVSHRLCRDLLDRRGRQGLQHTKRASDELREIELVLPQLVFDSGSLMLYVGDKTLRLWHTPGHSPDSIVCLVEEDRILLAADTLMPVPYFVDGSYDDFLDSLQRLQRERFENVVQGHGEVILRGEIDQKLKSDIAYLKCLRQMVDAAINSQDQNTALDAIDIEACGKSRIQLNGMVEQLHRQNVRALANQRRELLQQM